MQEILHIYISYCNPSLKYSQNITQNIKIHIQYRLRAMHDIMINLIQTNMTVMGLDDEYDNDMED